MVATKTLLASAAMIGALVQTAAGADLPPIYETPVYEAPVFQDVPEVVPVEIGSGWYLRGDVAYQFKSSIDARQRELRPDFAGDPYDPATPYSAAQYGSFSGNGRDFDLDAAANVGIGVGYQFTDYLRGDLTGRYWQADVGTGGRIDSCHDNAPAVVRAQGFPATFDPGLLTCDSATNGEAEAIELMANAYADLGTFVGFTPYVGAGVGAVRINYDDVSGRLNCAYGPDTCDPGFYNADVAYDGEESWRFAYSLMAGISYDLSKNLKIDVGYRYLDVDGGAMYDVSGDVVADQLVGISAEDDGFQTHSIQAGIRYALW